MERLEVVCRAGKEADTSDVMELTSTIWEGGDYVPKTWADWLADTQGLLAVAEYQGRVLGLGKLSRLTEQDWWLEGLRVHPEYEGRGIASQLTHYLIDYWLQYGNGAIRLATSAKRVQIHHLSRHHGMQKILELTYYAAPALADEPNLAPDQSSPEGVYRPVNGHEAHQAAIIANQSASLTLNAGLMDLYWQWAPPNKEFLSQEVARQRAFWWRDRSGVLVFGVDTDEQDAPAAFIKLLAGPLDELPAMLRAFRRLARQQSYSKAGWLAPLRSDIATILKNAGYQREWDSSLYLFAKKHPA